jgi:hypothetical protein
MGRTALVLSYVPEFAVKARAYLRRLIYSSGKGQLLELSRVVLRHCENFVLSPAYFETWTDKKKRAVLRYYGLTMWANEDPDSSSPDLYLF